MVVSPPFDRIFADSFGPNPAHIEAARHASNPHEMATQTATI